MTCTCTHPREAHVIVPSGVGRVEPCGRTEDGEQCPRRDYREDRRG